MQKKVTGPDRVGTNHQPACFGSSQIVISSLLGEPKQADLFYIKTSEIYALTLFLFEFLQFYQNFGSFQ